MGGSASGWVVELEMVAVVVGPVVMAAMRVALVEVASRCPTIERTSVR